MAGYGTGMQQNSNPSVMGDITRMNNFNQQFGGRSVIRSGQQPSQPRTQGNPNWGGKLIGMAQNFLRRL